MQIIRYEHACAVPSVPCRGWSAFRGFFTGSDVGRGASQNSTTSTLVSTIVEQEQLYYDRKARNHFKLNVPSSTRSQGLSSVPDHIDVLTCALQKQGSMSDKKTFQTIHCP